MINSEPTEALSPAPGTRRRLILGRLLAGPLMLTASNAHADTGYGYCWQSSCNGKDPIQENCRHNVTTVSSYTYTYSNGARYEVDLRYSVDCEANWARVVTSTTQKFCIKTPSAKSTAIPRPPTWRRGPT